ncbi:MAG: flagellar motor switch phosphatase FliY [Firmicutes bacterium]|nr:flagellar motor switch phosphatase FliY [Bacillota bacterium]
MEEQQKVSPLDNFNDLEQDALKEIGNISLGSSATILSQLTSRRVNITTPTISYKTAQEINNSLVAPCILIDVEYVEGIEGKNLLVVNSKDAVVIGQLMMMEEPNAEQEINEIHLSALSEAMNQMMGASATSMSDIFNKMINISTPKVEYMEHSQVVFDKLVDRDEGGFIQVAFRIELAELIDSELLQLIPVKFAREMADYLIANIGDNPTEREIDTPLVMEEHKASPLDDFNDLEQDALKEIGNISLGSSATILSQLTSRRVNITTPTISYKTVQEINSSFKAPCVLIEVEYVEGITGSNLLIVNTKDAVIIGQLMMMEEPNSEQEINEIHLSAMGEAMNQMMGASATAMSDIFNKMINISTPKVAYKQDEYVIKEDLVNSEEGGFIQVAFRIELEGLIDSEILQLIPIKFSREMVDYLIGKINGEPIEIEADEDFNLLSVPADEEAAVDYTVKEKSSIFVPMEKSNVFYSENEDNEFNLVENIVLKVHGVVGRIKMPLEQVLNLDRGSVLELDSDAGEDVEVFINGKHIMNAEIVAVGNQYGLRLTKTLKA